MLGLGEAGHNKVRGTEGGRPGRGQGRIRPTAVPQIDSYVN